MSVEAVESLFHIGELLDKPDEHLSIELGLISFFQNQDREKLGRVEDVGDLLVSDPAGRHRSPLDEYPLQGPERRLELVFGDHVFILPPVESSMTPASLLEAIRCGLVESASEGERRNAAEACETLLTLLRSTPGEPLVEPRTASPLAQAVQQVQAAPPSVVLDALIAKLQSLLPEDERTIGTRDRALKIPFVDVRPFGGRGGRGDR